MNKRSAPPPVSRFSDGVVRRVLQNGLTVLVKPMRSAPVVAVSSYVRAGYFNEPDNRSGLAHLLEHMYFKGCRNYPGPEDIGMAVEAVGGMLNAGTIYDYTHYYFTLPRDSFRKGVEIQADALAHPLFDPDELRKEAEVIIEESKRKYDNPSAFATEKLYELAFDTHWIRRWRMGSDEALRSITRETLVDFFSSLYRPSNMIVAVVGDIDPDDALSVVESAFGGIPAGTLRKETSPSEPPQTAFKYRELRGDINQTYLDIGFHTPGILEPDTEALDLLSAILGSGRSARLFRRIKEERRLVDTIGADSYTYGDIGLFHIDATLDAENREAAVEAVFDEIGRLSVESATDEELDRALAMVESGYVFQQQTVNGQAFLLAYYEAYGGYALADTQLERLYGVTPDAIGRVAAQYLTLSNCSMLEYVPIDAPQIDRNAASIARALSARRVAGAPASVPAAVHPRVSWPDIGGAGRNDTDIQPFTLPNGITLLIKEHHAAPLITIGVYCRGGRMAETPATAGLSGLALRVSRKGTVTRDAETIAREIESLGASVDGALDADYAGYSMTILRRHFSRGFDIFQDIIRNPVFPDGEVDKERDNLLAAILQDKDSGYIRPFQLFNEAFFGTHPYALPSHGREEAVRAMTRKDLRRWHAHIIDPGRMVIVVAGDVDTARARALIEQSFGAMQGNGAESKEIPPVVPPSCISERVETRQRIQTAMAIGFPGADIRHADRYALEALANIASSFGGRLFMELRGRQSLAYDVAAYDIPRLAGGAFVAYIASDVSKESRAREGLLKEFQRFKTEPPTEEEIARAQAYITGSYTIQLQTAAAQAGEHARHALLGLDLDEYHTYPDRIRQVTRDDLHRVANTYFDLDRYAIGIVRGSSDSASSDRR